MTTSETNKNKRIAKNTMLLYVRMILLMIISLYTSRVILNSLGVDDYGIYNVVGGVVTMFTMISGTLNAAITRFITYEMGVGNKERLKTIFSTSVVIQIGLSLIILILMETIGLWFLNSKMVMSEDRVVAANWCFQFSIITFCINLISVPYNAAIIAHEKMSAFAYISIVEALGKLSIALAIAYSPFDRLVFYGLWVAVLAIFIRLIYGWYCKKHFEECTFHFVFDKDLWKQMFGFAGWNLIGASAGVLRDQGGTLIINLFFGPAVNAAQAIAVKINSVVTGFTNNFMTAINPQITKSFASGDRDYMFKLAFQGGRLSFYMMLLVSMPILLNTDYLLTIWLKLVPDGSVLFVRLVLILTLFELLSYPLVTIMLATGNIRNYQIIVGGLQLLNLPVSFLLLEIGCIPQVVTIVAIAIGQLCLAARLFLLRQMVGLHIRVFLKDVYFNVIFVSIFAIIIPIFINNIMEENGFSFVIVSLMSVLSTLFSCLYIGASKQERLFVYGKIRQIVAKL